MAHISHQDWLVVGLRMLSQEGAAGLTIDALTRQQQVTKGSFYHHFHNHADFKTALLEYWEQEYTRRIVAFSETESPADLSSADPNQIFPRFLAILATESPAVEIAMRAWALEDETVRAYVHRIDELRTAHAERWFSLVGAQHPAELARLLNMLLIGSYSVFPPLSGNRLKAIMQSFFDLAGIPV